MEGEIERYEWRRGKWDLGCLKTAYEAAMHHHERYDGNGYPLGLRGEEIPIVARIVALADMYDAMTSERCYKQAFSHEQARETIIMERGGQFDPNVVDSFLEHEDAWLTVRNKFKD